MFVQTPMNKTTVLHLYIKNENKSLICPWHYLHLFSTHSLSFAAFTRFIFLLSKIIVKIALDMLGHFFNMKFKILWSTWMKVPNEWISRQFHFLFLTLLVLKISTFTIMYIVCFWGKSSHMLWNIKKEFKKILHSRKFKKIKLFFK